MKKYLLSFMSIFLLFNCSDEKSEIDFLYQNYEKALLQGDFIKAGENIDKIIKIDSENIKYIKLKIPLLINNCKKEESIVLIDKILEKETKNVEYLFLKILLLDKKDKRREKLITDLEILLIEKKALKTIERDRFIMYTLFIKKEQGYSEEQIKKYSKNFNLSEEERNVYTSLIMDEINKSIINCE